MSQTQTQTVLRKQLPSKAVLKMESELVPR